MPRETRELRMTRRFAASPERLFAAWTDPAFAKAWLFTTPESDFNTTRIDARVGGTWEIVDRRHGQTERALGEFLEVDPPRRLVLTFEMPQYGPGADRITVEITPDGDGAILTLTQYFVPADLLKGDERGWNEMFDALTKRLADAARSATTQHPL